MLLGRVRPEKLKQNQRVKSMITGTLGRVTNIDWSSRFPPMLTVTWDNGNEVSFEHVLERDDPRIELAE